MKNFSKYPQELRFAVSSGKINITDPCYTTDTTCALFNLPAEIGEWLAVAEYEDGKWGYCVKSILAHRANTSRFAYDFQLLSDDIGVDSGQCGIFDAKFYPQGESTGEYEDKDSFYGKVCELTSNDEEHEKDKSIPYSTYGIIDNFGVVSSSGYGDGCYKAYGIKNDAGELVFIRVDFLENEDIEEDDDDRCWDCGEYKYNCTCDDEIEEDEEE